MDVRVRQGVIKIKHNNQEIKVGSKSLVKYHICLITIINTNVAAIESVNWLSK